MSRKTKNKSSVKTQVPEAEKLVSKERTEAVKAAGEDKSKPDIREIIPVIILLILEAVFWRNILLNDGMLGDLGDGRFMPLTTEHWWQFLQGKDSFSRIPIFYPNPTSLGYSDLYIGLGIIHCILRLFGVGIYPAFKWTIILLHFLGTVTMYILLRRTLKVSAVWSLTGTVGFTFCCSLSALSLHPQLFAVGMLPLLLILFIGFIRNLKVRKKRNIYAYLTLAWFVLLVYTSWYVACFTGIFSLVFLIVHAIVLSTKKYRPFAMLADTIKTIGVDLIGYIIYTIVLAIPFIIIYVPVMKEGGMYGYSGFYLPDPIDLINVTEGNLMMGWFMKLINIGARERDHELAEGYSIVFLALFLMVAIDMFRIKKKELKFELLLPKSIIISVIVCLLLTIRWDGANLSLWAVVYTLLLPARAVHAVCRFLMWLCFPMSIMIAYWADNMGFMKKEKIKLFLVPVICALMIFSTISKHGVITSFNYKEREAFMDSIPPAPDDMESFYVTNVSYEGQPWFASNIDAWEIAIKAGKPTLNGYSGHFPAEWGLSDTLMEQYEPFTQHWIDLKGLQNVYTYNLATKSWNKR